MANFYGANHTKAYINVPSEKINKGQHSAIPFIAMDSYTAVGTEVAADVINLMKLPAGALIKNIVIAHDGFDATIDIGYAGTTQAFASAMVLGASAEAAIGDGVALLSELAAEKQVFITLADAPVAAKTVKVMIEYFVY